MSAIASRRDTIIYMLIPIRGRLLLWWGNLHIGEMIRRRAVRRELRRFLSSSVLQSLRSSVHAPSVRVLDAGCGRGDLALWIAQRYPSVYVDAVDIDSKLVELVQRRVEASGLRNVNVQRGDIEEASGSSVLQFFSSSVRAPREYGIIYSVDVFEHLKDPAGAIANLVTMLALGGILLIHVPRARQRRFFRRFVHYDQRDHERDGFEPEELMTLVRDAGLSMTDIRHTFGPPGALAWELFYLASREGKWLALLMYPIPWFLAWVEGWFRWKKGNGMLVVAQITKNQISSSKE